MDKGASPEQVVGEIQRRTRRRFSAEEKVRIVLEGLRGEQSVAELCRREGLAPKPVPGSGGTAASHGRTGNTRCALPGRRCMWSRAARVLAARSGRSPTHGLPPMRASVAGRTRREMSVAPRSEG